MSTQPIKLSPPTNVVAGSKATLTMPVGATYQDLRLKLTNITLAQITNIELLINGKQTQIYADGTELDKMNQQEGLPASANDFLTLHFSKNTMFTEADKRFTALGTADVNTCSLIFDIDAACINPQVDVWSLKTRGEKLGMIKKVKRFPLSATAGLNDLNNLPRASASIQRIHLVKSADDVTNCKIEADGVTIFDMDADANTSLMADYGRTKQAGIFTVDFTLEGRLSQALNTVYPNGAQMQDLRVMPTVTGAGNMVAIVEYLDGLGGI